MNLDDLNSPQWEDPTPFVAPVPKSTLTTAMRNTLLGQVAMAVEDAWNVPAIVTFTTGLGVASATTCGRFTIQKDMFTEFPLGLYLAPLLNPGGMKSPVLAALSGPVKAAQVKTAEVLDPDIAERGRRLSAINGALQGIERSMATAMAKGQSTVDMEASAQVLQRDLAKVQNGHNFTSSFRPVSFGSDATPEAIVKRAGTQGGRIAILSAEGGLLENLAGRYSEGSAKVEFLDAAFDGESYEGSRIGDTGRDIPKPWASIVLVVQPDVANTMLGSSAMRTRGFLQRWWFFLPPTASYTLRTTMPALPRAVMDPWEQAITSIWGTDHIGWPADRVVMTMPPQSRELVEAMEVEHIAPAFARASDEGNALFQGWLGKAAMTTWRVSALLAQLETPRTKTVTTTATVAAVDYAEMALAHADHLLAHGPTASTRSPRYRVLAALVRSSEGIEDAYIASADDGSGGIGDAFPDENGHFTKRDLFQRVKSQKWVTGADVIEAVLQELAGLGWVRFVVARTTEVGGRPSEVWSLHPDAKKHFAAMTGSPS